MGVDNTYAFELYAPQWHLQSEPRLAQCIFYYFAFAMGILIQYRCATQPHTLEQQQGFTTYSVSFALSRLSFIPPLLGAVQHSELN